MNWKNILVISALLGGVGGLLSVIASRGDGSGQEAASGAILCISCTVFLTMGCLQRTRVWLHALVVSILSYALGSLLSRLFAPALRETVGESLGGLVIFMAIALTMTGVGVWIRRRILRQAAQDDGTLDRVHGRSKAAEPPADPLRTS